MPLLLQSFADSATGADTSSIAANRTGQIDAHRRVSICARPATFRNCAAVAGGGTGLPSLATFRWPRRLLSGDPLTARHPRPERGGCAEAGWRDVHESPERLAREVHRPHVSPAHDGIEFVARDSYHQIASNDSAAHPTAVQEGEAAEHLAFGDVVPSAERLANAIRELLVVRHGILLLTVRHLLAVMARVKLHKAHVVLHAHGAEDGPSHPLVGRGGLPAGLVELLVRRLEANASLCRRRGSARG